MKIKSLLVGMLACAALTACSNQDIIENENGNGNQVGETKAYIGINIADPANGISRATGDFENGDPVERNISNALFVFYTDGVYSTQTEMSKIEIDKINNSGDNVEAVSKAVVVLKTGEGFPNQVVAFLNLSDDAKKEVKGKSLADATKYVGKRASDISEYATNNKFIMTNSVYLDSEGKIVNTTPVTPENFAQTEAAALANPVKIYVERMTAKVGMKEKEDGATITDLEATMSDGKKYTLKLNIDGWGLNGLNRTSYVLKNIDEAWTGKDWSWANAANNFRSYWAKDANYADGMYPVNSDEYNKASDKSQYALEYRSWNDINGDKKEAKYCLENTLTHAFYGDNINKTTHMIIVGHYKLMDGNTEVTGITELYKYINTFYTGDELIKHLASQFNNTKGIYTKKTVGTEDTYSPVAESMFTLERASRSDAKLYFNGTEGVTYYRKDHTAYQNVAEINKEILAALGTVTAFRDGIKTIFVVPAIKHLNPATDKDGNIGIVRNHVYKLTLNSIKNLGEGVYDPDEDIVTTPDEKEYYVGATLNILSWKVVEQGVDL